MLPQQSWNSVAVFALFVAITLGLSFWFAAKARSASGYFAAGGSIPWFVNGVAFAGDYLSAASFLGICGMIAFYGYDGFLYSIGYLAGWIVALLVIAEPLKRLGRYTFADALDARFHSPAIKLSAGVSTLVVSVFYLIPQMVGAGVLVKPLLGLEHWQGVTLVGLVVVSIVATAGMVSTTYVQFLKGSLLVVFSTVLTVLILQRGLNKAPHGDFRPPQRISASEAAANGGGPGKASDRLQATGDWKRRKYARVKNAATGEIVVWRDLGSEEGYVECQTVTKTKDGRRLVNGLPQGTGYGQAELFPVGHVESLAGGRDATGPLDPVSFLGEVEQSRLVLWSEDKIKVTEPNGDVTTVYYPETVRGSEVLLPGGSPTFKGLRGDDWLAKLNFVSLMLALFGGTASLPHILIRYYTVKNQSAARKSTVVGIAVIGFFYVLTLFMGLGAMTGGVCDVTDSNMAAPLLAKSFGELLFAVISAIAFTTVLGTVAGLIVAASGAIVHDLVCGYGGVELNDSSKVRLGRLGAMGIGLLAIGLGIVFGNMNVTFLVGWAFSIAASANLPSLVMLLFWKGTTREGITAAILVGMTTSLAWVLLSADTYKNVYGLAPERAPAPFSQPGLVTIPLGFLTVVVVSLLTRGGGGTQRPEIAGA